MPSTRLAQIPRTTIKACSVMMAAAHDLNDDLTVVTAALSEAMEYVDATDPIRPYMLEALWAAQRAVWKTSGMLNYGARNGGQTNAKPMERLISGLEAE